MGSGITCSTALMWTVGRARAPIDPSLEVTSGDQPVVVLFGGDRTAQAQHGVAIRQDAHDIEAACDHLRYLKRRQRRASFIG